MTYVPIPLPPHVLMAIGLLLALVVLSSLVVLLLMPKEMAKREALSTVQSRMGLRMMHPAVFVLGAIFWGVLFGLLCIGLLWTIFGLIWGPLPSPERLPGQSSAIWNWRFSLVKLTALTTVLAAVIALPVTLTRLKLTRDQNRHAAESLYNDKMNTAVADLYAQRQVTKWAENKAENGWEDDIPRRNGAIDRLKGLTDENPDLRPRVDRLLSVYLRELSREFPAKEPPEDASPTDMRKWAANLQPARSDMENAAQTLSRLNRSTEEREKDNLPDLKGMNLQKFDLTGLFLAHANLTGAQLQGASLFEAQLQGAHLGGAQLQGADLFEAQLQGADLRRAQLQGANLFEAQLQGARLSAAQLQGADLIEAQLQGADLSGAQFDAGTDLSAATLRGAALRSVDFTDVPQIAAHLEWLFGDSTMILPEGVARPARFDVEYESWRDFTTAWRAFQRSIGQDPADPK